MNEEKVTKNMKRCPSWPRCSQNLCPFDFELHLRIGGESDKCRWMREPQRKKIKGREFISGGHAMPNGILIFVPESNFNWLNQSSKKIYKNG